MKKLNHVIIIGCSISSLYAAIKFLDLGYRVTIIEKKNSYLPLYESIYHNFKIFNDNHKTYMNLLKKFDIKFEKIELDTKNDPINSPPSKSPITLINTVIQKTKPIPNNILMTHTFASICRSLMSEQDFNNINSYENIFSGMFNIINAMDCIQLFTTDITYNVSYYNVTIQSINELISKMLSYIQNKNGKIIYNNEVKLIKYIKHKFIIGTNTHNSLTSDILFTTISKDNLLAFNFWNNEQKLLFNTVTVINASIINNIIEYFMKKNEEQTNTSDEIRKVLLDDLHIVYPLFTNKSKHIYIWNNGVNNVLIRERIKSMYNDKFFICSESFSKNNMFINYSLESIDNAMINVTKTYKS